MKKRNLLEIWIEARKTSKILKHEGYFALSE